jgi:hypothetical protein
MDRRGGATAPPVFRRQYRRSVIPAKAGTPSDKKKGRGSSPAFFFIRFIKSDKALIKFPRPHKHIIAHQRVSVNY